MNKPKNKVMIYKEKAYGVLSQLGFTNAYKYKVHAEKEHKRIENIGYSAQIIPVEIIYKLK